MESEIALFTLALLLTCSPPDLLSSLFAARLYSFSLTSFFPPKGQQTAQLQASSVTCKQAALYLDSRRVDKSEPLVSMP